MQNSGIKAFTIDVKTICKPVWKKNENKKVNKPNNTEEGSFFLNKAALNFLTSSILDVKTICKLFEEREKER